MGCAASSSPLGPASLDTPGMNTRIEATKPCGEFVSTQGDIPACPPCGLVVKTAYTGLCQSDVYVWQSKIQLTDDIVVPNEYMCPTFKWPAVLGHEISGTVHELSAEKVKGAPNLKVGDRVVVFAWIGCGTCDWCEAGKNNFCANSYAHDIGVANPGGFQNYVAVRSKRYVVKLPSNIPLEEACMFGCSAITAYNACLKALPSIERAVKVTGSAKFLVVGAGGVGLWVTQIAHAMFPNGTKIFVASKGGNKLEAAKKLGAHEVIDWSDQSNDQALIDKTKTATLGIDGCVDTVSSGVTLNRVLNCMNKGGTIVAPGMTGGIFHLPLLLLTLRDVTLTGVYTGNPEQIEQFIEFYSKNKLKCPPLSQISPFQVGDAMKKLLEGKQLGRAVVKF